MKRSVLLLIITLYMPFIFISGLYAQEIPLSLDEAIALALRDNLDILLKSQDVEKAKAKIAEADASLFPTVNVSTTWSHTAGYYGKDISQNQTQVSAKQYIYQGGKTLNTIRFNGYNLEADKAILDKTKLELISEVKKAYYTLILTTELCNLNKLILENTSQHLDFLKQRYRYGEASESDILNIEASLENAGQAYAASLGQQESARALLNNLLYLDKDVKVLPKDEISYLPQEVAYDSAFLQAMSRRPEIRQFEAQLKASQKSVEIAKADGRPNIYASWDYYSRSHTTTVSGLARNRNDYNIAGITFSWPIFDGWLTKAKVEQALVDLKEAQLSKEKNARDIALELKNAYVALSTAIARLKASDSDLKFYNVNFESVRQKYNQGHLSKLDLNDAELKYLISMFNKKQATYDCIIAKADFEKATGGI